MPQSAAISLTVIRLKGRSSRSFRKDALIARFVKSAIIFYDAAAIPAAVFRVNVHVLLILAALSNVLKVAVPLDNVCVQNPLLRTSTARSDDFCFFELLVISKNRSGAPGAGDACLAPTGAERR